MREIKFRVWKDNKMDYDFIDDSDYPCSGLHFINSLIDRYNDAYRVMQYTGLKDKNGKDIYEGDVIRCKDRCGENSEELYNEVVDDMSDWLYNYGYATQELLRYDEMEVIGNIYENPELIKEETK